MQLKEYNGRHKRDQGPAYLVNSERIHHFQ